MNDKPRIGCSDWGVARPNVIAVYNDSYSPSGKPLTRSLTPWVVVGEGFDRFSTHSEAITHAFKLASK